MRKVNGLMFTECFQAVENQVYYLITNSYDVSDNQQKMINRYVVEKLP